MEFVKKNWFKLIVSLILAVGLVLTVILLFNGLVKNPSLGKYTDKVALSNLFALLAQAVFFAGLIAFLIMGCFKSTKMINKFVLLGAGLLALLFMILCIANGMGYISFAQDQLDAQYAAANLLSGALKEQTLAALDSAQFELTSNIFGKFISIILYALLPICYAVKKLFTQK